MSSLLRTGMAALLLTLTSALPEDFRHVKKHQLHKQPYELLQIYRRSDPNFIQGLYYDTDKKQMLESTGLYGESYT